MCQRVAGAPTGRGHRIQTPFVDWRRVEDWAERHHATLTDPLPVTVFTVAGPPSLTSARSRARAMQIAQGNGPRIKPSLAVAGICVEDTGKRGWKDGVD